MTNDVHHAAIASTIGLTWRDLAKTLGPRGIERDNSWGDGDEPFVSLQILGSEDDPRPAG